MLAAARSPAIIAQPTMPFRDPSIAVLAFPCHMPRILGKREVSQVIWYVSTAGFWTSGVHVVGAR